MTQSISSPCQKESNKEEVEYKEFHDKLNSEISVYLSIAESTFESCNFCDTGFKCSKFETKHDSKFSEEIEQWVPPNPNFFDLVTLEDSQYYVEYKIRQKYDIFSESKSTKSFPYKGAAEDSSKRMSFIFDAPESSENRIDPKQCENILEIEKEMSEKELLLNKNTQDKDFIQLGGNENLNSLLSFFKLNTIEDIFENATSHNSNYSDNTIIEFDISRCLEFEKESSPILTTQIPLNIKISRKNRSADVKNSDTEISDSSVLCRSQKDMLYDTKPYLDIIDTSVVRENISTTPKSYSQIFNNKQLKKTINYHERKEVATKTAELTNSEKENSSDFFSTKENITCNESKRNRKSLGIDDIFELRAFGLLLDDFEEQTNSSQDTRMESENARYLIEKYNSKKIIEISGNEDVLNKRQTTGDLNSTFSDVNKIPPVTKLDIPSNILRYGRTHNKEISDSKDFGQNGYFISNANKQDIENSSHVEENNENIIFGKNSDVYQSGIKNSDGYEKPVIQHSAWKDSFIDLTVSPTDEAKIPPKKKILSQMSITQILSLVEKPTQSTIISTDFVAEVKKSSISKPNNKRMKLLSDLCEKVDDSENLNTNTIKSTHHSLQNDLRNLDEFGEFVRPAEPSPSIKFQNNIKLNSYKNRKDERLRIYNNKPGLTSMDLSHSIDDPLNSVQSISVNSSNSDNEFEDTILPEISNNKKQYLRRKPNDSSQNVQKKKVKKKKVSVLF